MASGQRSRLSQVRTAATARAPARDQLIPACLRRAVIPLLAATRHGAAAAGGPARGTRRRPCGAGGVVSSVLASVLAGSRGWCAMPRGAPTLATCPAHARRGDAWPSAWQAACPSPSTGVGGLPERVAARGTSRHSAWPRRTARRPGSRSSAHRRRPRSPARAVSTPRRAASHHRRWPQVAAAVTAPRADPSWADTAARPGRVEAGPGGGGNNTPTLLRPPARRAMHQHPSQRAAPPRRRGDRRRPRPRPPGGGDGRCAVAWRTGPRVAVAARASCGPTRTRVSRAPGGCWRPRRRRPWPPAGPAPRPAPRWCCPRGRPEGAPAARARGGRGGRSTRPA